MDGKPCAGAWITASVSKWLSLAVSFSVFSSFEKQVPIAWHRGVCLPREKMRVNASQPGGGDKARTGGVIPYSQDKDVG